jgi:hypothetical protein
VFLSNGVDLPFRAEAVTAGPRVCSHASPCGICGEQSGTRAGFLRQLGLSPCLCHSTRFSLIYKRRCVILHFYSISQIHYAASFRSLPVAQCSYQILWNLVGYFRILQEWHNLGYQNSNLSLFLKDRRMRYKQKILSSVLNIAAPFNFSVGSGRQLHTDCSTLRQMFAVVFKVPAKSCHTTAEPDGDRYKWLCRYDWVIKRLISLGSGSFYWDVTQLGLIVSYRRFGTTCGSHPQGSCNSSWTLCPLKMGALVCPETSLSNYQSTLRNMAEKRRPHLHRGGNLKSRVVQVICCTQK